MAQKQSRHRSHPDFRHRSQMPMPAVADVEQRLFDVRSPSLLAPRQLERHDPRQPQRVIRMRQRLLTLPVLVAIIVSLVWRRIPAVAEVQRVLAREGLLWEPPLPVSPQAITKRLDVVPAAVMGQRCAEVWPRLQAQVPPPLPHPHWAPVRERFPLLAIVDGSTLEALRKKAQVLREQPGLVLAGKVLVMVEAFSHRPLWQALYRGRPGQRQALCGGDSGGPATWAGCWCLIVGFFSFLWFDALTERRQVLCHAAARKDGRIGPVQVLERVAPYYRDEIIAAGPVPCESRVSIRCAWCRCCGRGRWYRYLTNVLDPQALSARQVCAAVSPPLAD